MLRHIFQFCVLESSQEILDLIHKVYSEYIWITFSSNLVVLNFFYNCYTVVGQGFLRN